MKKYPKHLKKMMVLALISVMLPIIVLGIFSSYMSSNIIKSRVVDSNIQIMVQTRMRVEQVLKSVDSSIVPFLNSAELSNAINQPYQPDNFAMYNELSKSLYNLQSNNPPFFNVHFINIKDGWVQNFNGLFKLDDFQNSDIIYRYASYEKPSFWVREDRDPRPSNRIDGYFTINGVSIVKKIPINALNAEGIIIVQIRQTEFDKLINNSELLGDVMIIDDLDYVLQSAEDEKRGKDISLLPYIRKVRQSEQDEGYFEMPVDGDAKVITFSRSQYNDWLYLSMVSEKSILTEANSILYLTLFTCLVILIIFGALAVFMSMRMGNRLQDKEQQMKEELVKKLLLSDSVENIKSKLNQFPCLKTWKYMSVISVDIFELKSTSYKIGDRSLVLFAMNNIVSDLIPQEQQLCPIITDEGITVLVGGSFELINVFQSHVRSMVSIIQESLDSYLGVRVDIGVSRPFDKIELSHQAYKESKEALKYRFRSESETSIFFDDIHNKTAENSDLSKTDRESIIGAVRLGDKKAAKRLLNEYIDSVVKSHINVNEYQVILIRLIVDIVSIMPEDAATPIDSLIDEKTFLENINNLKNSFEAQEWIMNFIISPVIDKMEECRMLGKKKISQEIMEIVEKNYDKDLDLTAIAEKMHYNPNYIRRIFSEETGITFSEYLLDYRLNIAKKLLLETDMKINEIAAKLNYKNPQNFIRSFRKKEGVTPGEYRKGKEN